jgi:hypothetical protein
MKTKEPKFVNLKLARKNLPDLQECQTRKKIFLSVFDIFMPSQLILSFIQVSTI